MVPLTRRKLLSSGGCTLLVALGGCTALPYVDNPVDMIIINKSPDLREVEVEAIEVGKQEYSEALALHEWYDIPAPDGEPNAIEKEDVLPSGVYRIRVTLDSQTSQEFHFYPDCTGGSRNGRERPGDEFYLEIQRDGRGVEYSQNTCSDDAWIL